MKRSILTFAAAAISLSLLGACETAEKKDASSAHAAPMNTVCPLEGSKVDSTATSSFQGHTVAFCCQSCKGKFDKMADAAKSEVIAKLK